MAADGIKGKIQTLIDNEQYDEALTALDKAEKTDPSDDELLYLRAKILLRQREHDKAIALLQKAITSRPYDTRLLSCMVAAYTDSGQYDKAIEYARQVTALQPDDSTALFNLGYAYKYADRYNEALEYLHKALDIDPHNSEILLHIGDTYCVLSDYENAEHFLQEAAATDPNDWDIQSALGYLYGIQGQHEKSIEYFKKAVRLSPSKSKSWENLGNAHYLQDQYREAVRYLEKALNIDPANSDILDSLGYSYIILHDYPKAIISLSKATEISPDNNRAWLLLGIAYIQTDDPDKALPCYENAYRLNPQNGLTCKSLASIYAKKDLFGKAAEIYRRRDLLEPFKVLDKTTAYRIADLNIDENTFFKNITSTAGIRKSKLDYLKRIYLKSLEIVSLLHIDNEYETAFAHYTRKRLLDILIFPTDGDNSLDDTHKPTVRLNSIVSSNDPKEGMTLLDYLFGDNCTALCEDGTDCYAMGDYRAFATCFTFDPESLNQFRLYGKENGQEATGVSIIFDKTLFEKEIKSFDPLTKLTEMSSANPQATGNKLSLFRCIYIDPVIRKVISIGHKEQAVFDREQHFDGIRYKKRDLQRYATMIDNTLQQVRKGIEELSDIVSEAGLNDTEKQVAAKLLMNLRYLTKHSAFKEEQECRIIKIASLNGDEVHLNEARTSFYINYGTDDIKQYIRSVIFAPMASGLQIFHDRLINGSIRHIKARQCAHPFK